jgi:hypothetical protein
MTLFVHPEVKWKQSSSYSCTQDALPSKEEKEKSFPQVDQPLHPTPPERENIFRSGCGEYYCFHLVSPTIET